MAVDLGRLGVGVAHPLLDRAQRGADGVPLRTLQELMGHGSVQTTEIYADYAPSPHEQGWAERAFGAAEKADPASPDLSEQGSSEEATERQEPGREASA